MIPSAIEQSTLFTVIWWLVAAMVVIAAFLVVHLRDLLRAALALIASFVGIAGLFVMLNAEFVAVAQLLIYAGAIPILIIFAILLLRDVQRGNPYNRLRVPALFLSAFLLALLVFVVLEAPWRLLGEAPPGAGAQQAAAPLLSNPSPAIGALLTRDFVLPLELAAVLLLAGILGALALARER